MKVIVYLQHRTDYPHFIWCQPVGWIVDTSWAPDDWCYDDGAFWGPEEEEAGLCLTGGYEGDEGDEIEVNLSDLVWRGHGRTVRETVESLGISK